MARGLDSDLDVKSSATLSLISIQVASRPSIRSMRFFSPKAAAKGSFKKSAVIKHCYQTLPKVLLK